MKQGKEGATPEDTLGRLLAKGVRIPLPATVEIGTEVRPERISGEGVTIYPGCRIFGDRTLIMPGVELGYEGPVTVDNCLLGKGVSLKGGFFSGSCFLRGAGMGSGAQVREGCLLEEGARGAHAVGLKQTILFPFVTLGSLINFCDCLMAGGTDEKNHSEVGSSYIHFNYTPNQDKATPSMLGDVPRGVLLNQPPIFLGGQGGMVGPVRIAYGTVVAAGTIVRRDILSEKTILFGNPPHLQPSPFQMGLYRSIERIVSLNTTYLANLIALRRWYLDVRFRFAESGTMEEWLLEGAVDTLERAVAERLKRMGEVAAKMPRSIALHKAATKGEDAGRMIRQQEKFLSGWPRMKEIFEEGMGWEGEPSSREAFLNRLEKIIPEQGRDYIRVLRALGEERSSIVVTWLQGLVDSITGEVMGRFCPTQ